MTDQEHVLQELEIYVDAELSEEDCRRIEQHLADCPDCFDRERFLVRLREIVRRKCGGAIEVPADVSDRIRRALKG